MPPFADVLQWEHLPFPKSLRDFPAKRRARKTYATAPRTKAKICLKVFLRTGVSLEAKIMVAGTLHRLGRFESPRQAALAYKSAAKELHREFARV